MALANPTHKHAVFHKIKPFCLCAPAGGPRKRAWCPQQRGRKKKRAQRQQYVHLCK